MSDYIKDTKSKRMKVGTISAALIAFIVFGVFQYFVLQAKIDALNIELEKKETNEQILSFTQIVIEDVLQSSRDITLDERLRLENSVRDIGDDEIFDAWEAFTGSVTELEAQNNMAVLLNTLIDKIQ